jgi:hypothetical protein
MEGRWRTGHDEDVFGLYVAVDDALRVQKGDGRADWPHDLLTNRFLRDLSPWEFRADLK